MAEKSRSKTASDGRSKQRKLWDDQDMKSAMSAVRAGQLSISAASSRFSVPRKTLDDRMKGRVAHGSKPGVSTALSLIEEDALVSYLLYMANRGFPLTRTMVKAFAWSIAKRTGKSDRFNLQYGPGEKWWTLFKQRHPQLALRRSDSLERSRAEALNPAIVNEYYDLLHGVLNDNGILNSPRQIFNCDETFVPLDYSREKVVTRKGAKNVYRQSQGTSEHITMLCSASAAGLPLPPLIIFAKSFPGGQYRFDGPDDSVYAKSESGWIDTELFITWFKKIFLKHSVAQRPLLLLIDGHKSHMGLELVDLCRENSIIMFCLPPHTTHALQPLDVSVFKSLKDHYSKSVRSLTLARKNFVVTKREFARIIKSPFERAFSIPNIKAGFAKCGVYPFNRNAVPIMKMMPSSLHDSPLNFSSSDSSSDLAAPSSSSSTSVSASPISSTIISTSLVFSTVISTPPSHVSSTIISASPVSSTIISASPVSSTVVSTSPVCSTIISASPVWGSPVCSPNMSTPSPVNPLVMAGLIPGEMADILATPSSDAAMTKKRTKRITGARDLTADDYREMLLDDKKRKEDLEQQKIRRMEEREEKKREREKKKEEVAKRKGKKVGKRKGQDKLQQQPVQSSPVHHSSDSDSDAGVVTAPVCSVSALSAPDEGEPSSSRPRPRRRAQLPSRFRSESDSENDGAICTICNLNEPEGLGAEIVFWIDCSVCGEWVHNVCAFRSNTVTRQYVCKNC